MSDHGGKRTGSGRPKGQGNKKDELARQAIAKFVDGNAERLQGWLDEIAEDSPEKAFNAFTGLLEYHVPKLSRQEQQALNKDGEPTDNKMVVEFVTQNVENTDT